MKNPPSWARDRRSWIDVSILEQSLVAYEGATPKYVTLVSTGVGGLGDPEQSHATVRGTFLIHTKHVTVTMDSDEVGDEFDLADTAARDEDMEDDIEDEGVVEGEIEDGDVEEDDRGRAGGDDNEAEYDAQPGREDERAPDRAPTRELRPGTPGPRRDVRGRGRSGGRWR